MTAGDSHTGCPRSHSLRLAAPMHLLSLRDPDSSGMIERGEFSRFGFLHDTRASMLERYRRGDGRIGKSGWYKTHGCDRRIFTREIAMSALMLVFAFLALRGFGISAIPTIPVVDLLGEPYNCRRHELLYPQIDRDLRPWEAGIDEEYNAAAVQAYCGTHKGHVCLRIRNGTLLALLPTHQPDVWEHLLVQHAQHTAGTMPTGKQQAKRRPGIILLPHLTHEVVSTSDYQPSSWRAVIGLL